MKICSKCHRAHLSNAYEYCMDCQASLADAKIISNSQICIRLIIGIVVVILIVIFLNTRGTQVVDRHQPEDLGSSESRYMALYAAQDLVRDQLKSP